MSKIALPNKIDFQPGENKNQSLVSIEPCFPGYGITLANSLRRVLLSSLSGAAVIGVKIKGIEHEFMALPHLKEDILEFILNLKQIRLKVHSNEIVKLTLQVHGEKEITAKDIEKNSEVEIVNPDVVLGHITDMSGNLEAEIFVQKGMGYETTDSRLEKSKEIGYIEIDSIYSPVESVGLKVDNVRVGKETNWDQLILDITTDGTIEPKEAFDQSVKILIEQFSSLSINDKVEDKKEEENTEKEEDDDTDKEEKK